jgi:DNA polymerase III delta subunit
MPANNRTGGKFSAFCRKLEESSQPVPYVIYVGESAEELEELLSVLRKRLSGLYGSCDEVHLSGLDNEITNWHAELMTMPMFPSGRLILVRHAEALLKRIETHARALQNYLHDIPQAPDFTVTVLQFKEKKIPKKMQIIEDLAQIYEDVAMTPPELVDHLVQRAAALGFKTDRDTIEHLVDKSAGQQKVAFASFDRLITFRLHEKEIRVEDVEEVATSAESNLHFQLLDLTAQRNIGECLQLLQRHALESGEQFIAALVRLFSEALRYHYYRDSGMQLAEIGQIISTRPMTGYPLKKSSERWTTLINKYSPDGIRLVMDALLRADALCRETADAGRQQVILTSLYLMLSRGS